MKNILGAIVLGLTLGAVIADEKKFAQALTRWEEDHSLVNGLHVLTSGFFLARDIEGLA